MICLFIFQQFEVIKGLSLPETKLRSVYNWYVENYIHFSLKKILFFFGNCFGVRKNPHKKVSTQK